MFLFTNVYFVFHSNVEEVRSKAMLNKDKMDADENYARLKIARKEARKRKSDAKKVRIAEAKELRKGKGGGG